jgi:hypothetical protein
VLKSDSVVGIWESGISKTLSFINLVEDYSGGSIKFEVVESTDTALAFGGKAVEAVATTIISAPVHAETRSDREFLKAHLFTLLDDDASQNFEQAVKSRNRKFLENFKHKANTSGAEANEENSISIQVIRNGDGLIVFKTETYGYSGEDDWAYRASYSTVDMKTKKAWALTDILNLDTVKLQAALDKQAHWHFRLPEGDSLSKSLAVTTMPVTDNFYFSERGITFCYDGRGLLQTDFYEEVCIYVPFAEIGDMLTSAFKQRMHLEDNEPATPPNDSTVTDPVPGA